MATSALSQSQSLRWLALAASSTLLGALLAALHIPAAVLLACMVCAIAFAVQGANLAMPRRFFVWAQGLLGCLIAHSLQPRHLGPVLHDWPLFLATTLVLIVATTLLGWWLMRRQVMPGSTALWGMSPGGASVMVLLAEQYGADMRLVAFMQYTRVLVITLVAALVTRLALGPALVEVDEAAAGGAIAATTDLATLLAALSAWWAEHGTGLIWTALLVLGASPIAQRMGIPGGAMLAPLIAAALSEALWDFPPALPPVIMLAAYAAIGWTVGLRFTSAILRHALRALPQVLLATVLLMLVGLLMAAALVWLGGVDPLSAFLATCPGGVDAIAIIAATSAVNASFVMSMQVARLLVVLAIGPWLTQQLARWSGHQRG